MSIASEITRLQGAKADIKSAIEAKGVTVPSNALLDTFDTYIAQIASGSTGLEYESGTIIPESDAAKLTIKFTNTHSEAPFYYCFFDQSGNKSITANSNIGVEYIDYYKLFGYGIPYGGNTFQYASLLFVYNTSTYPAGSSSVAHLPNNSDQTSDSVTYPRFWTTKTKIVAYTKSDSRYWRAGRTYKWIAIWV